MTLTAVARLSEAIPFGATTVTLLRPVSAIAVFGLMMWE